MCIYVRLYVKTQLSVHFYDFYLLHLGKLPAGVLVVAQVFLVPHQDNWNVGAEVFDLGGPLLGDVL